ncbi:MAG: RNA polymerase sigma factor [Polyangiaceae bacterium]|nr:RNA polymerase sigma factor [Polyangiaceae bacterium]
MRTAPSSSDDERPAELLARVAAGDDGALVRFYERSVDGLYRFVFYRVGKDAAACEDVVQETFLAALGRTDEYDAARGSLRSWLCQLSRNVIRKHLRAQKRTVELAMWERLDDTLTRALESLEREALLDEVLEQKETHDLVYLAMDNLPDSYRRVLEQKYVDGATLEALATERGLSVDAVKSLLARARRAFREALVALGLGAAEVVS